MSITCRLAAFSSFSMAIFIWGGGGDGYNITVHFGSKEQSNYQNNLHLAYGIASYPAFPVAVQS